MTEQGKEQEFEELEPLDELEELEELEPHEDPEAPSDAPPAAAKASAPAASGPGKRELEQTPIILRKASLILLLGSILPWLVALAPAEVPAGADSAPPIPWGALYTAKLVALVAAWIFHQGVLANHDGPAIGPMKSLAGIHKMVPDLLFLILAGAALYLVFGAEGLPAGQAAAEVATMLLAAATFSHIWGYEHGGKFNPIFPIMFLGPALAGLLSVFGAAAKFSENKGLAAVGLLGCLTVAIGGCMAIYALYNAMKQAKEEGERKKAEQRERRKAERAAKRKAAGGS